MREVLDQIELWRAEGRPVAVATVVETWGSAPRAAGAKMALAPGGRIAGSVSGGCVETAVVEAGLETLETGRPRLLHYGVADDTAWSVGLACGGSLDVFVERLDDVLLAPVRGAVRADRPAAVATVIAGPDEVLGRKLVLLEDGSASGAIDASALEAARRALARGCSVRETDAGREVFVDVLLPAPHLIVVGGVHIAVSLVTLARALGFRTTVVDPRAAFANADRFPHADAILPEWPDAALSRLDVNASTAVAVLTHDPKLDDPALIAALRSPAFYVGALGSRRTQEKRRIRLVEAGMAGEELSRLRAPIGLPLGGRSPEEIALSILAQIVEARNAGGARSPSEA